MKSTKAEVDIEDFILLKQIKENGKKLVFRNEFSSYVYLTDDEFEKIVKAEKDSKIDILGERLIQQVKKTDSIQKKYELLEEDCIKKSTAILFYMFFLLVGVAIGIYLK